jgi:hypothetical protein
MTEPVEFPYKPKAGLGLLCVSLFGCGAYFARQEALTNSRGLILDHIFYFDVHGATIFYWIMTALSASFVPLGLIIIISSITSSAVLRLTETNLHVPPGIFQRSRAIPFSAIFRIRLIQVKRQHCLEIQSESKKIFIKKDLLPFGAFEQVCTIVAERTKAGQLTKGPSDGSLSKNKFAAETAKARLIRKLPSETFASKSNSFGRRQ